MCRDVLCVMDMWLGGVGGIPRIKSLALRDPSSTEYLNIEYETLIRIP